MSQVGQQQQRLSPDGKHYWDGQQWRQLSPDGRSWWDGTSWHPVELGAVPAPGPARKRRRWPWVAAIAGALLVLGVCTAALSSSSSSSKQSAGTGASRAGSGPAAPPACVQPCANANGWIVQTANLKYDAPSGNQFVQPEAGNVYVTVDVTFINKTSQEQHANPFEFVLRDPSGVKHSVDFLASACETWSAVNLTTGASLGPKCLAFQAAAGKPAGLKLVWTPHFFGGGDHEINLS
jgi:hypothetical protein